MQNAFEAVVADEPQYAHIKLDVVVLPILVRCDQCNEVSEVQQYRFVCACGEPCRNVIQGEELLISEVEFHTDQLN
jgi:hydrogenase nickel incorporation protein HypA/HybF